MYGLSKNDVTPVVIPFPVAVDNVCRLTRCEYVVKVSKDNSQHESIEFQYSSVTPDGVRRVSDTRWAINPEKVKAFGTQSQSEAVENAYKTLNTVLRHIAINIGCTDSDFDNLGGDNFEAFATDYCKLINAKLAKNNPELYLKTVKENGYTHVSKYVPFIQRVDAGPCELQWTKNELKANADTHANGVVKEQENYV